MPFVFFLFGLYAVLYYFRFLMYVSCVSLLYFSVLRICVFLCTSDSISGPPLFMALILINNKITFHCTAMFQVVSEASTVHLFTADRCNECDNAATKRRRLNAVVLWHSS